MTFSCADSNEQQSGWLAVEGWIDTAGYPVVQVSATIAPDDADGGFTDLMVRWAKVTLSDGDTTVVMTGGASGKFFPPYRYYSYAITGKPDHLYTLTVEYNGMTVTSSAFMLQPTPIDSIAIDPIAGNDTLRAVTLLFTAPDDCPAYYLLTLRQITQNGISRPYPVMLSPTEVHTPGTLVTIPIYNPKLATDTAEYSPNLSVGQMVEVDLCRVDRPTFEFWRAYDNLTLFGNTMFIANQGTLPSNVSGGYGIFSVRATSSRRLQIP